MEFRQSLVSTYCANPCQVLPNALWKTLAGLNERKGSFRTKGASITRLEIWGARELLLFWDVDRTPACFPKQRLAGFRLALVHRDYISAVPEGTFARQQRSFRLIHRHGPVAPTRLPDGFSYVDVDVAAETEAAANLINRCYDDLHPSAETVASWTAHPVFDPHLWIWVMERDTGLPVALGIAEIDASIAEGSLEWVQVLPEYRRQGIGKALVSELLSRLAQCARFTTVGGQLDDINNPQALYYSCGFEGQDVWWILRSHSRP